MIARTLQKSSCFRHTSCHCYTATPKPVPFGLIVVSLLRHRHISADHRHVLCLLLLHLHVSDICFNCSSIFRNLKGGGLGARVHFRCPCSSIQNLTIFFNIKYYYKNITSKGDIRKGLLPKYPLFNYSVNWLVKPCLRCLSGSLTASMAWGNVLYPSKK